MKPQILIDTDILIDISREIQLARNRLKKEMKTSYSPNKFKSLFLQTKI